MRKKQRNKRGKKEEARGMIIDYWEVRATSSMISKLWPVLYVLV
jgi:hypothetical protein